MVLEAGSCPLELSIVFTVKGARRRGLFLVSFRLFSREEQKCARSVELMDAKRLGS
jgi:hypothetical protein